MNTVCVRLFHQNSKTRVIRLTETTDRHKSWNMSPEKPDNGDRHTTQDSSRLRTISSCANPIGLMLSARTSAIIVAAFAVLVAGCNDQAARSNDDIVICRRFYTAASLRMGDLESDTFQFSDLTPAQLAQLTPSDPDWRDAQFLALKSRWSPEINGRQIVIICNRSRVVDGHSVHCVGYNSGETAWVTNDELKKLRLQDYAVLPKIGP